MNIKKENNLILVFVENRGENFIYVIQEASNNIYDIRTFNSFNNIANFYLQNHYKVYSKIYNFEVEEDLIVSKTTINNCFNRLIVLFNNSKVPTEKTLKVYKIENNKSVYDLKFSPR